MVTNCLNKNFIRNFYLNCVSLSTSIGYGFLLYQYGCWTIIIVPQPFLLNSLLLVYKTAACCGLFVLEKLLILLNGGRSK